MDEEAQKAADAAAAADKVKTDADASAAARDADAAAAADKSKASDGTQAELKRLQDEVAARDAKLALFEGLNPEEAKTALAERHATEKAKAEAEKAKAEAEGNWERVRELMVGEQEAERKRYDEKIALLTTDKGGLETRLNTMLISQAFADSEFVQKKMSLPPSKTRQLYNSHVEIEDGKPVVYTEARGEPNRTKIVDANGKPMGFNLAIAKVIEADPDKDSMLASSAKPGANSRSDAKADISPTMNRHEVFSKGFAELRARK